ncbi:MULTISPECIES: peptidase domain-containing ABC transporter [unclassified Breznakia]|uniref:peptidase domain-containing ABC transporter n=1 Tax=unclassified Breznakia TaxID=2623764 RepID=UPI00240581BE|nr:MULTISPECIES: peptidase domain-containing ABC transporter [unclassified Breznakia]MDF9838695.1 ABC-type bacteriocin transporter [Breznakia sp. PFB2-8]MDF9860726.1 ABC-type bacteriocin transporter [Breznakia sp. PH5-24]
MFKKYPCVLQHDHNDCAAAALSTILLTYGSEVSILEIRDSIKTDLNGTTVKGIIEGLEKFKFQTKALRTETQELTLDITLPAIAMVHTSNNQEHFVVLHKIKKNDTFIIADPAKGIIEKTREEFDKIFTGVFIMMIPMSDFEKMKFSSATMYEVFKNLIFPHKALLLQVILISMLLSFLGIFVSLFSKVLMDEIIPYQLKNTLYIYLLFFIIVTLFQNILSAFRQHILLFLARKIDIPLLLGYYQHILHLPYKFFVSRRIGDIITRFQDASTIKEIFTSLSISLVMDIVLASVTCIVLFSLNSTLFLVLAIIVLINIVLIYAFKGSYKKINYKQMEASSRLNSQLIESLKNIETIKAQNDEKAQMNHVEENLVTSEKIAYQEGRLQNLQSFLSNTLNAIGNLVFMGVGAIFIIDGNMTIGDLLVFQTLSQYFMEPVQSLVSLQLSFQEAHIAMQRLSELMSLKIENAEKTLIHKISLNEQIRFSNVTFAYGNRIPILNDFSLVIPPGKAIALIGESGAGKSTIIKLLLKFLEVNEGKISFGKHNIVDIDTYTLRQKIAYIPQNIELFTGTIIDNLQVGHPEARYEDIILACKQAGADEFIDNLPDRYMTFIEEGASNLSGGEQQRLALARALLGNPDLYVFDEVTSNLDSFSELRIHELIFKKLYKKTRIIVAHRLSTIRSCDEIYFIKDGEIIEKGSHDELMRLNGQYAKMISLQESSPEKYKPREEVMEEMVYE